MNITDAQLLEWNRKGLIPGPEESEDQYYERVQHCLNIRQVLELDPSMIEKCNEEATARPLQTSRFWYAIEPDWIPIVFGNKHLAPWHGGCAWIFQMVEKGPLAAFIQLRSPFLHSLHYLRFYDRDEIVAHEFAHACRMTFQEPAFEEVLAYRCSKRKFTQLIGPIVESSVESVIFMLAVALVVAVELVSTLYGFGGDGSLLLGLMALPVAMIVYGSCRLWLKFRSFDRCRSNLMQILDDEQKVNGVLYRLKDEEIRDFASQPAENIFTYIQEHRTQSLRWRVIALAFFPKIGT